MPGVPSYSARAGAPRGADPTARARSDRSTRPRYPPAIVALGASRPLADSARALVARAQQAVAQRGLVLRARVPLLELGQLLDRAQAEQLEEQRGRAVEHGAERRAAGLLDQAALDQRRVADSEATPRMRAISGRETGCR